MDEFHTKFLINSLGNADTISVYAPVLTSIEPKDGLLGAKLDPFNTKIVPAVETDALMATISIVRIPNSLLNPFLLEAPIATGTAATPLEEKNFRASAIKFTKCMANTNSNETGLENPP
jgi:hypothetical protein